MQRTMAAYTIAASIILAPGVGLWDHKHGQSDVAAHVREVHPALSRRWVGMAQLPSSHADTPRPTRAAGAGFFVRAYVIPDPVFYGAYPTLNARSIKGADCTARVVYSTGEAPRSFDGSARTVGSSGVVGWTWHMQSSGTGGTATVTCSFHGQTRSVTTSFSIA
jgi:hypothetical protein